MAVTVVDFNTHPTVTGGGTGKHDRLFFNAPNYHVWVHYSDPGFKGPMHKHTAPETFYCLRGSCWMNHPDGSRELMTPGVAIIVPEDEFYQLEGANGEGFVLWGTRPEPYENPRVASDGRVLEAGGVAKLAL